MNKLRLFVVFVVILSGVSFAETGCLDEGARSVKLVLDDIYEEMGRPEMTKKTAEEMDHLIFVRDGNKEPMFYPQMSFSWTDYKNSITGIISCEEDGTQKKLRLIWRPDQDLEIIDLDVVLEE